MKRVGQLLNEWQNALQIEIEYLKKFGSSKFLLLNGRFMSNEGTFIYFFETSQSIRIPIGASVRIQWGGMNIKGRILSSEGKSVIVSIDQSIGDFLTEVYLYHDPWELLEKLSERLNEIKKNKIKRSRIKRLLDPSDEVKHPTENFSSNVQELMLRSQYNAVTFVWGPPGTGKTYTLARVAASKYINDKRILVLAHSNQAVDVLMVEISTFLKKKERFKEGDILRHGLTAHSQLTGITSLDLLQNSSPDLAKRKEQLWNERKLLKMDLADSFSQRDSNQLLELEMKLSNILEKIRQKEAEFVENAKIIGATLAKAASDPTIYENEFDLVIVDEVSQAYVPQLAFAVSLAKRSIICGDFKQLPPIAAGRHPLINEWLKEDIFHKSRVTDSVQQSELHPQLLLLKEQRRMHPEISAFTNKYIYHSLVKDHPSVAKTRQDMVKRSPFPDHASILLDMCNTGQHCINERTSNSRMNLWQLLISFQLIYESYKSGARSIGYISPYRSQALLMEMLLEDIFQMEKSEADIIAATVHRFQGSERDVMIFDTVEGYPQERPGMLLFGSESERLINVAITRTKGKFIQVSDTSFIKSHISRTKTIRKLVDYQMNNRQAIFPKDIGTWINNQHPKLKWVHAKKLDQVRNDILHAKRSILISIPTNGGLNGEWHEILNNRRKGVDLTLISEQPISDLEVNHLVSLNFPFPFILIDGKILWLGLPLEGAIRIQPPYVAARLESNAVCEYFSKYLSI